MDPAVRRGLLGTRRPVLVEVYTRAGCGLCERAERLVAQEASRAEIRYLDVDADPELQRRYNSRVPVVAVNGHEIAEAHVPPGTVRRAVRRARWWPAPNVEDSPHERMWPAGHTRKEGT